MKINFIKIFASAITLFLLMSVHSAHSAEGFGRLFTTNTNRAELNYLRQTKKLSKIEPAVVSDQPVTIAPIALPDAISMQGYVKRSDGKKSTIWLNNQAVQENESLSDVRVGKLSKNGNRVPLKLPANGKNFSLKAGQVYNPANNSVSEAKPYAAQGEATSAGRISDDVLTKSNE